MPNYLPDPADIRDAARYRRLRELIEYGDFLMYDARDDTRDPREIDYGRELDAALDTPETAERGDALIKLREKREREQSSGNSK